MSNILRVAGGTVYAGGQFSSVGGRSRHNVAAINAGTGGVRRPWRARADGIVDAMTVRGKTIYLGARFPGERYETHTPGGAQHQRRARFVPGGPPRMRPCACWSVIPRRGRSTPAATSTISRGSSRPYLAALGTASRSVHRFAAQAHGTRLGPRGARQRIPTPRSAAACPPGKPQPMRSRRRRPVVSLVRRRRASDNPRPARRCTSAATSSTSAPTSPAADRPGSAPTRSLAPSSPTSPLPTERCGSGIPPGQ